MATINAIVDLQFGSSGKGLLAGYLAKKTKPDTIITAWAPNAGHTFVDKDCNKMVTCMIPNGIVSGTVDQILIGPGSVINPELMMSEIEKYIGVMAYPKIFIHEHAAVVTEGHRGAESVYGSRIGSTMKGCGEAVIDKIRRATNGNSNTAKDMLRGTPLYECVVSGNKYNERLYNHAEIIQIEGAQGYSLGINSGFYPYTTSRECTIQQLLVDCGIPMQFYNKAKVNIYGAARTFPIRVSNRYDNDGNMIGWSGPCYPDQEEITWDEVGVPPEFTTVTKLQRRVFSFSMQQIVEACQASDVDFIFLNFANYMKRTDELDSLIRDIQVETKVPVVLLGFGPKESDVVERDPSYMSMVYDGAL